MPACLLHGVIRALEVNELFRPKAAEQVDLFLDAASAIAEVLSQSLVLDVIPADAHAETQAPTRQHVDRRRLLRDKSGLALREDDDARCQLEPVRRSGKEPEQHERFMKRRAVVVWRAKLESFGMRAEHMVVHEDVPVSRALGRLRVVANRRRVVADLRLREHSAQPHRLLLLVCAVTACFT
jgi:hypothetical protein